MICNIAIHDYYPNDSDPEVGNLWMDDVNIDLDKMGEWDEEQVVGEILRVCNLNLSVTDVISDGWHIVKELNDGGCEWLAQGSTFCEDKLINLM